MLKVDHLSTGYGKKQVLFDVSFEVKQGEIVLLIGSNGSGKSTVLKSIYGLMHDYKDTTGKIIFNTENITNANASYLIKKGLLYIPQKNNCFDGLTVKENLEVSGLALSNEKLLKVRFEQVLQMYPSLAKLLTRKPLKMSGGERQLLVLAMASLHQPQMILMDEPFAGLSLQNIEIAKTHIVALHKNFDTTILIAEHNLKESLQIAQRVIGMKHGRLFNVSLIGNKIGINQLKDLFI